MPAYPQATSNFSYKKSENRDHTVLNSSYLLDPFPATSKNILRTAWRFGFLFVTLQRHPEDCDV